MSSPFAGFLLPVTGVCPDDDDEIGAVLIFGILVVCRVH